MITLLQFFVKNPKSCLCLFNNDKYCCALFLCSCLYNLITVTGPVKYSLGDQDSPCLPHWLTGESVARFFHLNCWNTG